MTESYTISVIVGSESGLLGDVRLRVTSASGTDPEQIIEGITYGVATPIGTRGASITFTADVGTPGDFTDDFITGDTWTWDITQAYTAPTTASGGTYTGATDTTYLITVTRGGDWTAPADADKPQISVTTSTPLTSVSTPWSPLLPFRSAPRASTSPSALATAFSCRAISSPIASTAEALGAITELILANSLPVAFRVSTCRLSSRSSKMSKSPRTASTARRTRTGPPTLTASR